MPLTAQLKNFNIVFVLDPHAVDQFIDKTPFDILTNDDYESNVNALFGCTLEVNFVVKM